MPCSLQPRMTAVAQCRLLRRHGAGKLRISCLILGLLRLKSRQALLELLHADGQHLLLCLVQL